MEEESDRVACDTDNGSLQVQLIAPVGRISAAEGEREFGSTGGFLCHVYYDSREGLKC